ncbi:hypothetical protein BDR22DRAFT_973289 [Usnea florida]
MTARQGLKRVRSWRKQRAVSAGFLQSGAIAVLKNHSTECAVFADNRFAVLGEKEPASSIKKKRETSSSSDSGFGLEGPVTLLPQTDVSPHDEVSLNEKRKDILVSSPSSAVPCSKRPPIPSLPSHANRQSSSPTIATISRTKSLAQPPPLVLCTDANSVKSLLSPAPAFDTAAPHISIFTTEHPPKLPIPPVPQDPLSTPTLATLPIHPSLDFRSFTAPKSLRPECRQFASPTATSSDHFNSEDPMHDLVKSTSGRIFAIAAEIAAANMHSAMKPVGVVMFPAKRIRKVEGRTKRKKLKDVGGSSMILSEEMGDESGEDGDGWLGKEEGFVSALAQSAPLLCLDSDLKTLLSHIRRSMLTLDVVVEAAVGEVKPFEDEDKDLKSGKLISAIQMELRPSDYYEGWAEQYSVSNSERSL